MKLSIRNRGLLLTFGPAVLSLIIMVILDAKGADFTVSNFFFQKGGPNGGWIYADHPAVTFLYKYGELAVGLLAIGAGMLFGLAHAGKINSKLQGCFLVFVLAVAIGPGLIVNGVFKNYWGRPRPVEIQQYGGTWEYHSFRDPGTPGRGKSFPCGHCSMGYALVAGGCFVRIFPAAGIGAILAGLIYGSALGLARLAQGGHFITDVVASAGIVMSISAGLYYFVLRLPQRDGEVFPLLPITKQWGAFVVVLIIVIILNTPYFSETYKTINFPADSSITVQSPVDVHLEGPRHLSDVNKLHLSIVKSGLGFPGSKIIDSIRTTEIGSERYIKYDYSENGHFFSKKVSIKAFADKN